MRRLSHCFPLTTHLGRVVALVLADERQRSAQRTPPRLRSAARLPYRAAKVPSLAPRRTHTIGHRPLPIVLWVAGAGVRVRVKVRVRVRGRGRVRVRVRGRVRVRVGVTWG